MKQELNNLQKLHWEEVEREVIEWQYDTVQIRTCYENNMRRDDRWFWRNEYLNGI